MFEKTDFYYLLKYLRKRRPSSVISDTENLCSVVHLFTLFPNWQHSLWFHWNHFVLFPVFITIMQKTSSVRKLRS